MPHFHKTHEIYDYAEGYIWQDEDFINAYIKEKNIKKENNENKIKNSGGSNQRFGGVKTDIKNRNDIFENKPYSTIDLELLATVSILFWFMFTCLIYQYKVRQARYSDKNIIAAVAKKPRIFILNDTEEDLFDFPSSAGTLRVSTLSNRPLVGDFDEKHVFEPLIS